MLHCEVAGLALLDEDTGMLRYAAARGPRADVLLGAEIPLGRGLLGAVAASGETIVAPRLRDDARWVLPLPQATVLRAGVFARLNHESSVMGAIAAMSLTEDQFGADDGRVLSGLADYAALAVEHARDVAARLAAEEALHRSDERYRLAFESTQDVILDADLVTGHVIWSPRTYAMFGFEPEQMGETLAEWGWSKIHPDDAERVQQMFFHSLKGGGAFQIECRHLHRDGSYRDILSHAIVVHDEDGRGVRCVGSITDMTQRNQVERDLREARDAALAAARAKSSFLATMSHEIRTPLNGVIGMTGLLLDTSLQPRQREYAEAVRRSGEALLGLINEILDFSKIEYGRLELEVTDLDVREIVEDVAAMLADEAHRKGLEIAAHVPPSSRACSRATRRGCVRC